MANIYEATVLGGELVAGDKQYGFYGEVPASELWTSTELSNLFDITEGKIINNETTWLKWSYHGKTLFRPKKAIRDSISWDTLHEKELIYGNRIIEHSKGYRFVIRLMKGALTNPSKNSDDDRGAKGSEWNRLMLPIHIQAKDNSWRHPQYVEDDIPYWGTDYTDSDLGLPINGTGASIWCQETLETIPKYRVYRGRAGVSYTEYSYSHDKDIHKGWAPVLELISPNKLLIKKDNQCGYYTDSFHSLGTSYPTKEQFKQYGMSDLSILEAGDIPVEYEMELISETEEEKCFSYSFDLNGQHKNMKSIDSIITE